MASIETAPVRNSAVDSWFAAVVDRCLDPLSSVSRQLADFESSVEQEAAAVEVIRFAGAQHLTDFSCHLTDDNRRERSRNSADIEVQRVGVNVNYNQRTILAV